MDSVIIHSYDDRDRGSHFSSDMGPLLSSRHCSKRAVRVDDGSDVAAFLQCGKTYSGTVRNVSLLLYGDIAFSSCIQMSSSAVEMHRRFCLQPPMAAPLPWQQVRLFGEPR
jgi:hypothetical protein